jgi:hypothetical protein
VLQQLSAALAENQALKEQLTDPHKRIEKIEKQKTPPPALVKPEEKKPRSRV